ncbi:SusC/RagA family protein [Parabacteroides sp. An277]|uniref:SusC/RagA family TonB-linked outer membrane protein n=1 Tax=Parabacteroides sp. An277 TaxID=1965619 RepID=UPI000B37A0B7|nr:TonB-dependent receptor [Parabacteroides sp. An277]OUO54944.1 SusC/RagA family protein [Parabacteroides sp. An277]
MRKRALPVGYCHRYPWFKRFLHAVPLIAGISLANAAWAADEVPGVIAMAQQQAVEISGTVVDPHGEPLMGVNVVEVGTTNGTMTDMDGRFTLSVPSNATLQFSYIGYASQDVQVNGQRTINITLQEDSQNLDELVVVGYGTVRKADLAGSVSVLSSKSFKDQPIIQVSDALQGRVSGVQVQNSGVPGGTVKIRVRGSGSINRSNDPLYVVDGIVRQSGLTGLNPEDIQSMQVLKDASSTAIYGSRGANGVVLITTKTGKANTRQITFDAQIGIGTVAKRYETLNAYEFANLYNTYRPNTFSSDQLTAFQNGTAGTDWQDEIYQTGVTQDYKLSLSSGNEKTQYLFSANYAGQEGVVIENSNKRYQGRLNLTSQLTKWLHLTADVSASHNVRRSGNFAAGKENIVNIAVNYSPVLDIMNADGSYVKDPYSAITQDNPVGILKEQTGETITDIVNAHVDLKFDILPGLTFTTSNGVDYNDAKGYSFASTKVTAHSSMGNNDAYRMTLQTTNNLTYMGKWNEHSLTATAVYEATQSEYRYMSINGTDLLTEGVGWWNVNMASTRTSSNSYSKWALVSGVARVMYNYADRYMLTGTFRADGSSKFDQNKWGYFPSIAAAWSLGNEPFMQDQKIFQDLKIRASYGLIGSEAIDPYGTLGLMAQAMYAFGGTSQYTGYWIGQSAATPDLSWETTHQLDIGVDFAMLDHRLRVSLDYFDKRTKDGLLQRTIPNYDGGGSYWVNAAEVSNRGIDFSIDATIFDNKDFGWTTTFTGTYLKNEVKDLSGLEFIPGTNFASGLGTTTDGMNRIEVGQPIGAFYGYVWQGLDANGNDIYWDKNQDGLIDSNDRDFIGKSTPDFTFGWNNSLHWKNWELNAFFTASFGADRLNMVRFTGTAMTGDFAFITLKEGLDENFSTVGQSGTYVPVTQTGNNYQPGSTKYLEKANYFRLDNLSLSYNLPKRITKFADLRLTFSCQNLFTISGYKGMDPAGISFVGSGSVDVNDGIDLGAYPLTRTYTIGVRMNF